MYTSAEKGSKDDFTSVACIQMVVNTNCRRSNNKEKSKKKNVPRSKHWKTQSEFWQNLILSESYSVWISRQPVPKFYCNYENDTRQLWTHWAKNICILKRFFPTRLSLSLKRNENTKQTLTNASVHTQNSMRISDRYIQENTHRKTRLLCNSMSQVNSITNSKIDITISTEDGTCTDSHIIYATWLELCELHNGKIK